MERQQIITLLKEKHLSFINHINGLTEKEFLFAPPKKWTAGQQLHHIHLAVRPVTFALRLPKFFIRIAFGKSNRAGRSYEALVNKYLNKLENGGRATTPFIPKAITLNQQETIGRALNKNLQVLCALIEKYTEQQLDTLILPHPLLGKLTIREMLYFTIYHVEHHHQITRRNLQPSN